MPIALYMDVHIPRAIVIELRLRGVDVLRAQDDNAAELLDPDLFDRATALNRALFTFDDDLLREAAKRHEESQHFMGVIFAHQIHVSIGDCVRDLELIAKATDLAEWNERIEFVPF